MPPLRWISEDRRVTNHDLALVHAEMKELDALKVRLNREYCAKLDPEAYAKHLTDTKQDIQ